MKFSSFNWAVRGKRGWVVGPFFRRTLTITLEIHDPEADRFLADEAAIDDVLAKRMGWRRTSTPNLLSAWDGATRPLISG